MGHRIEVDPALEPVEIAAAILNEVYAHAREATPEECCGLLLGNERCRYRSAVRCRNDMTRHHQRDPRAFPRDAREAFYMSERDYLAALQDADERGERVTAVYHSHVECGAYFSELDQEYASQPLYPFPKADHLVVAVVAEKVVDQALFRRLSGPDEEGGRFIGRTVLSVATPTDTP